LPYAHDEGATNVTPKPKYEFSTSCFASFCLNDDGDDDLKPLSWLAGGDLLNKGDFHDQADNVKELLNH
jgi:hypothetical protein